MKKSALGGVAEVIGDIFESQKLCHQECAPSKVLDEPVHFCSLLLDFTVRRNLFKEWSMKTLNRPESDKCLS